MMAAVRFLKNFGRHAEEACIFPDRHARLHQPGRRGVPQRVWGDLVDETREFHSAFEPAFHGFDRLSVEFPEAQMAFAPSTGADVRAAEVVTCWKAFCRRCISCKIALFDTE